MCRIADPCPLSPTLFGKVLEKRRAGRFARREPVHFPTFDRRCKLPLRGFGGHRDGSPSRTFFVLPGALKKVSGREGWKVNAAWDEQQPIRRRLRPAFHMFL